MLSLLGLDPAIYRPHALHAADREYPETNCYADILIELMHARGDEPLAAMASTVRMDFEGDQWTFFKPAPQDMEALFGIEIHEMQPYRPLPEHIVEQIGQGRTVTVELDSFYLPDTEATAYRVEHVKSSAVVEAIDAEAQRLRYFHNGGLYELSGADYRSVLRVDEAGTRSLPPYIELVRFDAGPRLKGDELRTAARRIFARHLEQRPTTNPFGRFGVSLTRDLHRLLASSHADYHAYAFATVRMAGSAFEVCASHVDWLYGVDAADTCEALSRIVSGSKTLSFKLARRRDFDPHPIVDDLAAAWDDAMLGLSRLASDDGG